MPHTIKDGYTFPMPCPVCQHVAAMPFLAGAPSDIFNVGNGDFDTNIGGTIFISAGGGGDVLNVDDTLDGLSGDVYDFNTGQFSKPGQVIDYTQIESIAVLGSDQDSTYRINSTAATLTIAVKHSRLSTAMASSSCSSLQPASIASSWRWCGTAPRWVTSASR